MVGIALDGVRACAVIRGIRSAIGEWAVQGISANRIDRACAPWRWMSADVGRKGYVGGEWQDLQTALL